MVELIGIVLLIYGVLGIIATFIIHGKVSSPLRRLQELLQMLSEKLGAGGNAANSAGQVIGGTVKSLLQNIAARLGNTASFLSVAAGRFGDSAGFFQGAANSLNPVAVPALNPQSQSVDLTLNFENITDIHMQEHPIPSFIVFGPPLVIDRTPMGLNIGMITMITDLGMSSGHPFEPAAQALGDAAGKIEAAREQLIQSGQSVNEVKNFIGDNGVPAVENIADQLKSLGESLQGARNAAQEMSSNRLFALAPKLLLGYFGLIHLAFALAGIALLSL